MLFSRKLSRCISVVLASSAFCSNSLVSANTNVNTLIRAELKYLDKKSIPDGVKKELFDFFAEGLELYGVKEGINHEPGKVSVGDWFRDMMIRVFVSLNKENWRKVAKRIHSYMGSKDVPKIGKFFTEIGLIGLYVDKKDTDEITECSYTFNALLESICRFFDDIKEDSNFKDYKAKFSNYDVEYWEDTAVFFECFLLDISNKNLENNFKFAEMLLSHTSIFTTGLFAKYSVISIGETISNNVKELRLKYEMATLCFENMFIDFIYHMVRSKMFYRLILKEQQ